MKLLLIIIFTVLFSSELLAQCDVFKPLYGDNCVRSAKQKKADAQFVKAGIKKYGSADSAAKAHIRLAWSEFFHRNSQAAMKNFNQAWLLDPENPDTYFGLGYLTQYSFGKNAAEAEKYYQLGRDRDLKKTAEPRSLVLLCAALENKNDLEGVINASSQLIQSFPEYEKGYGYKKRSFYYTQAQLFDRAIEDSDKALQLDPQDPNAYVGRGYAYSWKRNHQQALSDYNQAIAIDPKFERAYRNRALLYADTLNQPNLALTDIEKAMQLEPKELQHYNVKSSILFKLNRNKEACECLKKGMNLGNKSLAEVYNAKCKK